MKVTCNIVFKIKSMADPDLLICAPVIFHHERLALHYTKGKMQNKSFSLALTEHRCRFNARIRHVFLRPTLMGMGEKYILR